MAVKEKVSIKNEKPNLLNNLLNPVNIPQKVSHLDSILEEIAEICSETNEDFSKETESSKQIPEKK